MAAQSQKANLEGLDFWIEFPSAKFMVAGSLPGIMHLSNTLNAPHVFSEMKGRYHDTSIGDFIVESRDGFPVGSIVSYLERRISRGDKGSYIDPHQHIKSEGYLERTFSLTNPGIYKISAKVQLRSTNWTGEIPGEWIEIQSPPVEIEILPSTNVSSVKPKLTMEGAPVAIAVTSEPKKTLATISPSDTQAPGTETRQATAVDQPPPSSKRNQVYMLVLGGVFLFAFLWLLIRRKNS